MRLLWLGMVILVLVSVLVGNANADAYNCEDFATRAEAQAFFEAHGGPEHDPYFLDADGDGIACEWGVDEGLEFPDASSVPSSGESLEQREIRYEQCEQASVRLIEIALDFLPTDISEVDPQELALDERRLYDEFQAHSVFLREWCQDARESIRERVKQCASRVSLLGWSEATYGFPLSKEEVARLAGEELETYSLYTQLLVIYNDECRFPSQTDFDAPRRCLLWDTLAASLAPKLEELTANTNDQFMRTMAQAIQGYETDLIRLRAIEC